MQDFALDGQRVLIRQDLNVPVKDGKVTSDARIKASIPTIKAALEAGAEDIASTDDGHEIWTAPDDLHAVAEALEKSLGSAETVKLAWKPNLTVDMDEGNAGTLLKLIDALDDDDDVQTVWGNYDISDEAMEELEG